MRLTQEEVQHIKHNVRDVFGVGARVFLFGSRVDDAKKGGDIDLFIDIDPLCVEDEFAQAARLSVQLKLALGDQKIDIVVARNPNRLIEQEIRRTRVLL